jgi:hypothetical protein
MVQENGIGNMHKIFAREVIPKTTYTHSYGRGLYYQIYFNILVKAFGVKENNIEILIVRSRFSQNIC